jgi:hypothetical protein
MLILKGQITHKNLNTAFTHIDQFVERLQTEQFTGYCHVSFWEYDGLLFFIEGQILTGWEEIGIQGTIVRKGEPAIEYILAKAGESGGQITVYALPGEQVAMLTAAMDVTPKYEDLSTELTSLDRLIALVKKDALSGYIEVLVDNDAGTANLFFKNGDLVEAVFAPPDSPMIAEHMSVEFIAELCQKQGAVFNVYQAIAKPMVTPEQTTTLKGGVPQDVITLFETVLVQLESATDTLLKAGSFQTVFKKTLPQVADQHGFLDPFLGEFRYANRALAYTGDATYKEFVDGLCDVINHTVESLLEAIPEKTLLLSISKNLELVCLHDATLIEQLRLEVRMPTIFQDYAFIQEREPNEKKETEPRAVLNLQGVGVSEIGPDNILREFYRIITAIVQKYCGLDGNMIQYTTLKKSREFQQYQNIAALLQTFTIPYLQNRNDKLAFWINLYNFLVIDGIMRFGVATSVRDTKDFFPKTSYRLGEYLFSLDDIEHGILRNNQPRPYSLSRQFTNTDPRHAFCIKPPDQRIHCCLVYGAKSSPPLMVYTPDQLNTQLNQAVTRFLASENGLRLDRDRNQIWLNRVLYWYRQEVEQGGKTLLGIVEDVQPEKDKQFIQQNRSKLTLRFLDYDWSLNGK